MSGLAVAIAALVLMAVPVRASEVLDHVLTYELTFTGCRDVAGSGCAAFGLTSSIVDSPDIRGLLRVRESLLIHHLDPTGSGGQVLGVLHTSRSILDFSFVFGNAVFTRRDLGSPIGLTYSFDPLGDLVPSFYAVISGSAVLRAGPSTTVRRLGGTAACEGCAWVFKDRQPKVFAVSEPPPWALMLPAIALFGLPLVRAIRPRRCSISTV